VLDEGSVPRESKHKCGDEDVQHKDEELHEKIRLVLRLDDFLKHFTR